MKEERIIFGRGRYFETKYPELKQKYHIKAIIDNALGEEQTEAYDSIPVYSPALLREDQKTPVLIMSTYFVEMWKQLLGLSVAEERILFGNNEPPYNGWDRKMFGEKHGKLYAGGGKIWYENTAEKISFTTDAEYKEYVREIYRKENPAVRLLSGLPLEPVSRQFGSERGKPADRPYIERFLEENSDKISGDVLEISDDRYTRRYGKNIKHSYVLHVEKQSAGVIRGNLETGEGIWENMADCIICTQTLQCIFDNKKAVSNIFRLLKEGGHALVTLPGISPLAMYDYNSWGHYWSYNAKTAERLFEPFFGKENVRIHTYGNVKTAMALLYGLCAEDLAERDYCAKDEQYPVITVVDAWKKGGAEWESM